jgi:hypothetical protein
VACRRSKAAVGPLYLFFRKLGRVSHEHLPSLCKKLGGKVLSEAYRDDATGSG